MAQETLYIKIDENVQVRDTKIYLKDIAQIICQNKETEDKVQCLCLEPPISDQPGRYVRSIMDIISCIKKELPELEIQNIGSTDFIITYEKERELEKILAWLKTVSVCILSFFGAGFSIMTFNNDVNIRELFGQIYELFTGQTSDGFTILELSYSLGIGLGIIVFFNHFAGKKLTSDPTPLEVQMRTYEDDVNQTIMEASRRSSSTEGKL